MGIDIFSFINSKAIRDYLRKIEYSFNSKEAAWLIYQCNLVSLKDKINAWNYVIQEMPDSNLNYRFDYVPDKSLHSLVRQYIQYIENRYEQFKIKEDCAVYQYRFFCPGDSSWCEDFEGIYGSLEECLDAIDEDMHLGIEVFEIRKRYISANNVIEVSYLPDKTVMDIYSYGCPEVDDCNGISRCFEDFWFDFPVPFEKGDILVPARMLGPGNLWSEMGPFVMDGITPWEKELNERMNYKESGDITDMVAWGYFQDPDGRIYREVEHNYMNLEYFEGPFEGPRRLLIALSNCVKDKIGLDLLLTTYRKIIMDEVCDDVMLHSWYSEEGLKLAGLYDVVGENNKRYVESGLNPDYSFYKNPGSEQYSWDKNQEVYEKCRQIASNYHQPKEMLFIYGKHGCGKTTILQCLGNMSKRLSSRNLLYTTAEKFVMEVLDAIRSGERLKISELREKYRTLDFMIVDDLQKLCGKEASTEEFTNTLNDLLTAGAQVVISADRPIEELDLPEELKVKLSFATQMEMRS